MVYGIIAVLMALWIILTMLFIYEMHLMNESIRTTSRKLDKIIKSVREER